MKKNTLLTLLILLVLIGCKKSDENLDSKKKQQSHKFAISDCFVQKGPFTQGSEIIIQELDAKFQPIGKTYSTETKDDFGSFDTDIKVNSKYVEIIAKGYYFNEITGKIDGPISLRTISNLEEKNLNINILTTLAKNRIIQLINSGKKTYKEAKKQAQEEILKIFNIPQEFIDKISNFENMDISKKGNNNAILLAISCILQNNNTAGELSEFISKIKDNIQDSGKLTDKTLINAINYNSQTLHLKEVLNNLKLRYHKLNLDVEIPYFENFIDSDGDGIINQYDCTCTFPKGDILTAKPTFKWTPLNKKDIKYIIQISEDKEFKNIIEENKETEKNEYTSSKIFKYNKQYYWRIAAIENGIKKEWDTSSFKITFGEINIISPISEISNTKPLFSWSHYVDQYLKDAFHYHLQIAKDENFKDIVLDENNLRENTYQIKNALDLNRNYYWRISIVEKNNVAGEWNKASFKINIGEITSLNPSGNIWDSRPTFTWFTNKNINGSYTFQLSSDKDFKNILEEKEGLKKAEYQSDKALEPYKDYYWRVAIVDENGIKGNWKETSINLSIDDISYIFCQQGENREIKLEWATGSFYIKNFQIQIASDRNFRNIIIDRDNVKTENYTIKGDLEYNRNYYVRIRTKDVNGACFNWTKESFKLEIPHMELYNPLTITKSNKPIFKWKDFKCIDGEYYHFKIYDENHTLVEEDKTLQEPSYTLNTILENGKTYTWEIAFIQKNGTHSEWITESFEYDSNIICYIPFNESQEDYITNCNKGIKEGNYIAGKNNTTYSKTAYFFDGYDSILYNKGAYKLENKFSISLWYEYSNEDKSSNKQYLICKDLESYSISIEKAEGKSIVSFNNGSKSILKSEILTNEWHHVCVKSDGANIYLYIDGSIVKETNFTESFKETTDTPFTVGAGSHKSETKGYYTGKLDNIRIYNRTLNEAEIIDIYNSNK
ncbi:MAG: LamG domain-containing protein [Marinifilaceae bacterium]|jgi:hypothetical protein|nr:LamG domain-containing protein [Marinifilaceae bacterium]